MIRQPIASATTAAVLALMMAGPATAETSPYYIGLSETVSHESNLLNLADGVNAPAGFHRADTIYTTALLGGFDQPFGRQRAYGTLSVRDLRYSDNSTYNNVAYSGNVGLDWSTIERISGSLTAAANRSLASFDNAQIGLLSQKNLQSSEDLNASVNIGLVTQYTFEATGGHLRVRNSLDQIYVQARNYDQDTGSLGVRWRPTSATNLGLALRGTKGKYPNYAFSNGAFQEDRFTQKGVELNGQIQPTGASTFDGRVAYTKTSYDLNSQRDFSGVTGSLGWVWQPGGRLRLTTRLSRDTGQDAYAIVIANILPANSDYSRVNNTLRLQADYDFSPKVALTAAWQALQRSIVNTILIANNPSATDSARDRTSQFSAGARWTPLRSVQLGCNVAIVRRDASGSPNLSYDFKNNVYSCYGQLTLQ